MISFSRGSRNCIGMKYVLWTPPPLGRESISDLDSLLPSLAYAELHTAYAHIVRRFDLTNAGTTNKDIDWKDEYVPRFKGTLKVQLKAL